MSGHMRSIMKRERRVTLMILAMLVAYLGTWTPYAVICILRMCGFHLSPLMDGYALLTAKTSGAINPFIFIFMNKSVSGTQRRCCKVSEFCFVIQTYITYSFISRLQWVYK